MTELAVEGLALEALASLARDRIAEAVGAFARCGRTSRGARPVHRAAVHGRHRGRGRSASGASRAPVPRLDAHDTRRLPAKATHRVGRPGSCARRRCRSRRWRTAPGSPTRATSAECSELQQVRRRRRTAAVTWMASAGCGCRRCARPSGRSGPGRPGRDAAARLRGARRRWHVDDRADLTGVDALRHPVEGVDADAAIRLAADADGDVRLRHRGRSGDAGHRDGDGGENETTAHEHVLPGSESSRSSRCRGATSREVGRYRDRRDAP